jgi:outer membrane protein
MKKVLKLSLLMLAMLTMAPKTEAQQIVYVNSAAILAEMPEVSQMRSNLEAFQSQLQRKGQQLVEAYQRQEADAISKEEQGQLSPAEKERILGELQTKQQEILAFEQEMQQKLLEKEQELLQPILDRVNDAINAVAEENGYTYIFDLSSGAILYADSAADVSNQVKAKL